MHRRALVTGGAGFIGSRLTRALLTNGVEVAVLDDLSLSKRSNVADGAEFIHGDVRSERDVRRALEGVGIVFHETAQVSIRSSVKEFYERTAIPEKIGEDIDHCTSVRSGETTRH